MRIDVQIDNSRLKDKSAKAQKNLAISTSQAINAVVKDVQREERIRMDRIFTLRRAGFMYRAIKIFAFSNAKQGRPFAEIGVDRKQRLLLGMFEKGGQRLPMKGKNVAVPLTGSAARPTAKSIIPEPFTFTKMKFKRAASSTGQPQWKGQNKTFLIPKVGVFQRIKSSAKGGAVRILYAILPPGAIKRLPASLQL